MKNGSFHDIHTLSIPELSDKYDLKIFDDGAVWDVIEDKKFADLKEWATWMEEESVYQVPYKHVPIKNAKYWDDD